MAKFDTGQKQYIGGKLYDPREQWGTGPGPIGTVYPDLPFGGYFMTGEQIAQAGPANKSSAGRNTKSKPFSWKYPQSPGPAASQIEWDVYNRTMAQLTGESPPPGSDKSVMERLIGGIEKSNEAQKNLLARYKPRDIIKEKSFFA